MKKTIAQKYPMLGSSQSTESISLTIKSASLALVPVIIAVCRAYELDIVENDLIQGINSIFTIVSCVGVIIGVARKFKK